MGLCDEPPQLLVIGNVTLVVITGTNILMFCRNFKRPGDFFQKAILFCNDVHNKCNTFVWDWPDTMDI